jgi:hypothetical protein
LVDKEKTNKRRLSSGVLRQERRVKYHSPPFFKGENLNDLFVSAKTAPIQISAISFLFIAYT